MTGDWRRMPDDVPTPKLRGCEPCHWWRKTHCRKAKAGWPEVGEYCYSFLRETGVEG